MVELRDIVQRLRLGHQMTLSAVGQQGNRMSRYASRNGDYGLQDHPGRGEPLDQDTASSA